MPTGYTACIEDGVSVREFILKCARGMGACIFQRDEPMDAMPKPEKISDYHLNAAKEAEAKLKKVEKISIEECSKKAKKQYKDSITYANKNLNDKKVLETKYNEMKSAILKWVPPTKDHTNFKTFMIEQIDNSIEFDCGGKYYRGMLGEVRPLTGAQWKKNEIKSYKDDIACHIKNHNEEVKRITNRNEWIENLYKSLPKE